MRDIVSVTLSCLLLATPLWAGPGSATITASAAAAGTPRGVEVNLATDATSDRFFFLEDSTPANEDAYGAMFYTRLDDLRLAPG